MIAHVGGVPVEEALPLVGGASAALLVARVWVASRLRWISGPARISVHEAAIPPPNEKERGVK